MMISDISNGGVRRSRDDTDVASCSGDNKRRKHDFLDNNEGIHLDNSRESTVRSPDSGSSDREISSSGLNEDLTLDLKTDLRVENEASNSSSSSYGFSRETSASSEICCLDSEGMETSSTLKKKKPLAPRAPRKPVTVLSSTMAAEIDEFFAVAEKKEQKRFADKYNYDITNDVPLDGRYEWICLKP